LIKVETITDGRIHQGDILQNVEYIEQCSTEYNEVEKKDELTISKITFPYVIVLTQDCDLLHDYNSRSEWDEFKQKSDDDNEVNPPSNHDKFLFSVIVAPLYNLDHFYDGSHLSDLGQKMCGTPSKKGAYATNVLKQNKNPRYHFLAFGDDIDIVNSVVDFKHYFTVNVNYLKRVKENHYKGKVSALYRELICQRFAAFLSRIALPD